MTTAWFIAGGIIIALYLGILWRLCRDRDEWSEQALLCLADAAEAEVGEQGGGEAAVEGLLDGSVALAFETATFTHRATFDADEAVKLGWLLLRHGRAGQAMAAQEAVA